MKTKLNILMVLALMAALVGGNTGVAQAAIPEGGYVAAGSVDVAPATPTLTAVDPLAWGISGDVIPVRPFLYSVDANGITITRFNDNKVVSQYPPTNPTLPGGTVLGTWPWPTDVVYTVTPDGGFVGLTPPAWEPVAMAVSYPTELELGNRVKPMPDLTPPPTYVYVVMEHSGYEWQSNTGFRDTIVPSTNPDTESALLIQIDVSDPSFSASLDPANPVPPHIAAALLGHNAGQPVYDRTTGNVYVGNMPSGSLPAGLTSFVSVIGRIPPEVAEVEAEVPGISMPVIRCGPQHPETGIPVGRPHAFACYDPGGVHPLDDNEHVGAFGEIKDWDGDGTPDEQYVWEFQNLPDWLTPHEDLVTHENDGILYGTPPAVGEWVAEARVHDLGDPFGVFSEWTPIILSVRPTAEYLPIKAQFAAGVPVSYPLEGTGSCALTGAPAWVDVKTVPNGCIVMGRAPLDGEYYNFTMPGFTPNGYSLGLTFSGNVFGEYNFVPLTEGVGLSGMAWRQISKVMDTSTETSVMSLEFIGVDPATGQLWRILPPPGKPQPPNIRPPETALTLDVVSAEGAPLSGSGFGAVAVEVDRDIYAAANGQVIKVSGGEATPISLPMGMQAFSMSLESDLRTAIMGVEPGQVDYNVLWAAGTDTVAVIDTEAASVVQTFPISGASSVSVDIGTRYAYVASGSSSLAIFGPADLTTRPQMEPRIWSAEEFTWNLGQEAEVRMMATGDGVPALSLIGTIPPGLTFTPNADGTATISGTPTAAGGGGGAGGELDVEGGDYAMTLTATSAQGTYAQTFGITVQSPPTITSGNTATFVAGSASAFQVTAVGYPDPIAYILDPQDVPEGVQLIDNEDGTASLKGTPTTPGVYEFHIFATTDCPPDAEQVFTLTVLPAGALAPTITSKNAATWDFAGDPFPPDAIAVTSIGSPTPNLTVTGTLPPGVTFTDNGDGTATIGTDLVTTLPVDSVGVYPLTISATNSAGTTTQEYTLTVGLDTTLMAVNPATLTLASDGTNKPTATITLNTQGDVLPYAVATTADWLSASPESGFINGTDGSSITISADPTGMLPGTYTGTVFFGSAGTEGPSATVAVTLTVIGVAPGAMGVWPGALRFDYHVGSTMPPAQTVWVLTGGEAKNYTVSTGEAKWLSAPASGAAPGGFRVSVNPRVGVGMHVTNLTIAFDNGPNAPQTVQTIPVTFIKTAGNANLIQVTFNVGGSPEGLATNLTTHNLFITSSSALAEAGGEVENGPEIELPGPPEPSSVFHLDPVNMKLVAEIVVHSEGEYIGVNSTTGMVYHASQGTDEVAVINGSTNQAVTFIPLVLNGELYQPYQVAIDEAQNLIYVGAKSPEPEGKTPDPLIKDANGKYGCKAIRELPSDEAPAGQQELECWHAGAVFVIDGKTNTIVGSFLAGDDPEGVVFAKATGKVYASNEDDGSITVAKGAKRNSNGTFTPPQVLGTIIHGKLVSGWWQPTCDANNYCGQRGVADLWPTASACYGIDDEAEEADKMAVDPAGNVYIIDDRYRVAKINSSTGKVDNVLAIPGYDCERTVPDDSDIVFRNTANNIAYMALGQGKLYIVSEQNTVTLIDPIKMLIKATLTLPKAVHLDAITTDPGLNQIYITDEELAALWILKGACANGVGNTCTP